MLNIKEIHELIKAIDESTIDEFVYENEGVSLKLKNMKQALFKSCSRRQ